ncbi:MAG: aldo/keto reductase family protein [Egibacteraceae bacterium]
MQYRKLGRWGTRFSAVGLGSWLTYGGSVEEQAAAECMRRAFELGITFFDTADVYAGGRAEEVVGKTIAELPRDQIVLATKVFFPVGDGPNDRGLSRKHIRNQVHASLRRLGVDYLDLYQCHRYDPETPLEETCAVMDDLVRAGDILYWGTSEWSADQIDHAVSLCAANGWSPPASNQPEYSALQRRIEQRLLRVCEDRGVGNVVWSPLAQGVLTGKYRSIDDAPEGSRAAGGQAQFMRRYFTQEVLDQVQRASQLADEAGCTPAQLALAWCLRQPAVTSVIVGATSPGHVEDNAAAADLDLDDELLARYDALLAPVAA